jgi:hypothetical protein
MHCLLYRNCQSALKFRRRDRMRPVNSFTHGTPSPPVQTGTRHDFGLPAENAGGKPLHIRQLK